MHFENKLIAKIKQYKLVLFLVCLLLSSYFILLYPLLILIKTIDFTSLYAASLSLTEHKDPYASLVSTFLPVAKRLPNNLNPPFLLWIFSPLTKTSYPIALAIWTIFSLIFGLIGAHLAFLYATTTEYFNKNWLFLYLFYLSLFSTLINVISMQLGSILLCFIMLGYHFYLRNQDRLAGFIWGLTIAFKLFPALLFFFAIKQRRTKVFYYMLLSFILACLIPYVLYGQFIYIQYIKMMSKVFWYGDNWNASLLGYLARLYSKPPNFNLFILYFIFFFILLVWYLKRLGSNTNKINHQPFCLTLTMMLLMSPFGWIYYFPILLFPLLITLMRVNENKELSIKPWLIWSFAFLLINIPQCYIAAINLTNCMNTIFLYSYYFYGLVLLNYLCAKQKTLYGDKELPIDKDNFAFLIIIFLTLMLALTVITLNVGLNYLKSPYRLSEKVGSLTKSHARSI